MQPTDRRHSDSTYERELEQLLDRVLFMGARVESRFVDSLNCFLERDLGRATALCSEEDRIRELEMGVDAACVDILSRRQAMASDLRFITMTFKLARDLQRIGALSTGICRRTVEAGLEPNAYPVLAVAQMGELARDMLRRALDAYVARDALLAGEVVVWDRQLDEQYRGLWSDAASLMSGAPSTALGLMGLLAVAKSVERIADHAVSVSEMVVFMVEGSTDRRSRRVLSETRRYG